MLITLQPSLNYLRQQCPSRSLNNTTRSILVFHQVQIRLHNILNLSNLTSRHSSLQVASHVIPIPHLLDVAPNLSVCWALRNGIDANRRKINSQTTDHATKSREVRVHDGPVLRNMLCCTTSSDGE